ncbi:hypothetical protein R1sor_016909 [Riccia sorocarpa]|uniref:Protein HIRA n=1 Tax=Riccia sorocarpa TaxID=122646 RepID=A0ABD3HG87_9MARC
MIVEKLDWLRHAGLQIFSLDIQPDGSRFATAGGDHKVRIWSMTALQSSDQVPSQPRLLATLRDHFGSVNCVRWAKGGHFVASGSDDNLVLVHKRHPGSGTTEFGSGEPPDAENWKTLLTLRGHSAEVVDLGWSPDDSMIASCSLDNTVRIWSALNGNLVSVLHGHTSLVKGVAWDPVGSFLASQSDDKTVIIWHTGNWSMIHRAEGPWEKTVGFTFSRRLAWSPCGHFITTTHGFQEPSHTAPVLERGEWCTSFDFVGHNAPVVAVRYNHSMFRKVADSKKNGSTNGSSEAPPYNVIAIGSQDCNITVWTTASPRPVFVGKHFFTQSVVDLSWSNDGYTLLCCSLDGTVAAFCFEPKELGIKVSDAEMQEFKKTRYGDQTVRGLTLVESASQLVLEAAAAKQVPASVGALEVQNHVVEKGPEVPAVESSANNRKAPILQQTEYRGPDGRRRIIPKPLGQDYKENEAPDGSRSAGYEVFNPPLASKDMAAAAPRSDVRERLPTLDGGGINRLASESSFKTADVCMADRLGTGGGQELPKQSVPTAKLLIQPPSSSGVLSFEIHPALEAPICLEARPAVSQLKGGTVETNVPVDGSLETDLVCSQGGKVLWWDRVKRKATILTGNSNFWAVAGDDRSVQVYTVAGRQALPLLVLSSPAAFMDCDKDWKLLVLTGCGSLHIWDIRNSTSILLESVDTLLTSYPNGGAEGSQVKVVSARISEVGAPLVVLENHVVFLFHMDLRCWLRIADSFPSSTFCELSPILTSMITKAGPAPKKSGSLCVNGVSFNLTKASGSKRAQLETQMVAALALRSAEEYRRCLLAYARCLARDADKSRLRELCEELLGPRQAPGIDEGKDTAAPPNWDPYVLGMNKLDLLKQDVLPAMASNRAIQRLLCEFVDLLTEIELRTQHGITEMKSWGIAWLTDLARLITVLEIIAK